MGGGTIQLSRQNTTTTEAVTAQQSLALVKNLLRVGLSQVGASIRRRGKRIERSL